MKPKKEMIQARIPEGNEWGVSELEAKAEELGLNKSELIIKAVDFFINLDNAILNYIKDYSKNLNIPEYLVVQNLIIKLIADDEAKAEVYGNRTELLGEFRFIMENGVPRTVTGLELKEALKKEKIFEYKRNEYKRNK